MTPEQGLTSPTGPTTRIGAALVVGGGVGGIQAALDLAESGIKVYLVENKPCIGGAMAQLDKTFPTNDCAMCTLAPRLVETGRHKDVEIITLADVEGIRGVPGNFTVNIRKRPRYVREDKCTGCGECTEKCPIEIWSEFNTELSKEKAIHRLYPQATPNYFSIRKLGQSPCRFACPAGQRVEGYVALIAQKRYAEAYRVIRRDNPFPSVCGRVCNHRCEDECTRKQVDRSVSIMSLKKFVADWAYENKVTLARNAEPSPAPNGSRVAVIGAGPAGLTAAVDLRDLGYRVTVFEALPEAGGMMRYGIPGFRMPMERLRWDIESAIDGVEVRTNARVQDIGALLEDGFRAAFLAAGAHAGRKLDIPGNDLPGVLVSTDLLRAVALAEPVTVGRRVLVLGGGNVALDVARTALRLGAEKVAASCLESREKMPAHTWEIEDAEQEGVTMYPARTFLEILADNGTVAGVRCAEVNFRGFDDQGRPRIDVIPGTEHILEADTVVFAIGQRPDCSGFGHQLELTRSGTVKVDPETMATSRPGVFAGGDAVTGTQFVIDAVAAGHKAARSIDRYLKGSPLPPPTESSRVELTPKEIAERLAAKGDGRAAKAEAGAEMNEAVAVLEASRCLECGVCSECLLCADTCKAGAIDHEMGSGTSRELSVGAVIVAPGFDMADAGAKLEFGYSSYPNVVTALEFERILSASGPYAGHVMRPSDRTPPKKVAFIQCIGSRDDENDYCSSVCCMYATKEAVIAKEHAPGLECDIFFMDLRAFGKGFDAFYERAKKLGVRYIRCRPSGVEENHKTRNLRIHYQDGSEKVVSEEYDMVVLSTGLRPPRDAARLSERLGIELDRLGFCRTELFRPVESSRDGVYVCGPFTAPKDIPETVTQASAAASRALGLLAPARGTLIKHPVYAPERDVTSKPARIGVFVCRCGSNIAGVVDVPSVVEYVRTLPDVVYAEENLYTCSNDTQEKMKKVIVEQDLTRVIVASCTPRTHEVLFRNTVREAGLNPYLFEMVNIRDQCSWVHMREPEAATGKARDLVRMAVAKSRLLEPLKKGSVKVTPGALVIGGGLAGMTAALELAGQGYQTFLVEKEPALGGNLRRLRYLLGGEDPGARLEELIEQVKANPRIQLHLSAEVAAIEGSVGGFKTTIQPTVDSRPPTAAVEHGVVIVATGAEERKPTEYLYGQHPRVLTQLELEGRLAADPDGVLTAGAPTVVMIQCVGSREDARPYCSRVCCAHALKNALRIKELRPPARVIVLYRDIRTYALKEQWYNAAREAGVTFIRYDDRKPEVLSLDGGLEVVLDDPVLGERITAECDLVVLSAATAPLPGNESLAQKLKVPLTQDKFFLEAHMKLRPVDFATEGIFLCGLAHSPKFVDETVFQAQGAAARAATILAKDSIELDATLSQVVDENCDGCAYCIDPCPYKALTLIEYIRDGSVKKTVETNEALCKGCGVCQATCPKKGIFVRNFRLDQLSAMVEAALEGQQEEGRR